MFVTLLLVLTGVGSYSQVGASVPSVAVSRLNLDYRQEQTLLPPVTSSFSYDYWWPYPPGGVFTSAVTPTSMLSSLMDSTSTADDEIGTVTSTSSDSSSTAAMSSSSILSTSGISTPPPTNSSTPIPTLRRPFPLPWLLPVLVVLGIISTSLSVWFCCGLLIARRGPRQRAPSLEPGPRYMPASPGHDAENHFGSRVMEKVALNDGNRPSSDKLSMRGSKYTWTQPQCGQGRLSGAKTSQTGERTVKVEETAPGFSWPDVVPKNAPKGYFEYKEVNEVSPATSGLASTRPARAFSLFSSRRSSPDPLSLLDPDECENEDLVPYDSLRHKSIRRGILERLKYGTLRQPHSGLVEQRQSGSVRKTNTASSFRRARSTHNRNDSDLLIDDIKSPESLISSTDSPRKQCASGKAGDGTEWVAGSGFRIVEEHLDAIWRGIRNVNAENDARRTQTNETPHREPSSGPEGRSEEATINRDDNYTQLPIRKAHSKPNTPRTARTLTVVPSDDDGTIQRVDSSILPHSPPQITSPPLESHLLFTPCTQEQISSTRNDIRTREGMVKRPNLRPRPRRRSSPISPLLLSDLEVGPRKRLVRAVASPLDARTRDDGKNMAGYPTPAERFVARHTALTRVEEIVSRSWSQRDVRESDEVQGG